MAKTNFEDQEAEILRQAAELGVEYNYLFSTTFDRYSTLRKLAEKLKDEMEKEGLIVEKEYIKGQKNPYNSPSLKGYQSVCESMNRTAATIMKIFRAFGEKGGKDDNKDPLMDAINGAGDEEDDEAEEEGEK